MTNSILEKWLWMQWSSYLLEYIWKFYLKSIIKLDSQIPLTLPNENAITEEEFTAIFNAEMKKLTEEN